MSTHVLHVILRLFMGRLTLLHALFKGVRGPLRAGLVVTLRGAGVGLSGHLAQMRRLDVVNHAARGIFEFHIQALSFGLCCR